MFFLKSLFVFSFVYSCMDQYDPKPYWEQFTRERKTSNVNRPKLSDTGELIVASNDSNAAPVDAIHQKFANLCSSCHGANGMGNGVAAAGLNPKPRNFHDKAWQAKTDDARIEKVLREGGPSVGLSASMVALGKQWNAKEMADMISLIRSYGQE